MIQPIKLSEGKLPFQTLENAHPRIKPHHPPLEG